MKADYVFALINAHFEGDAERFRAMILAMAAHEVKRSPQIAEALRRLADKQAKPPKLIELPAQMEGVLHQSWPTTKLSEMVLSHDTRSVIERLLEEQRKRGELALQNLRADRKLLLWGPPGVGKTMLASAIAGELNLPLLRVHLHALISSHLGETAGKLAKVFATMRMIRGVFLFDEFDAIGATREGRIDGADGEIRRLVNSLLTMIETDDSDAIIVGATNLAGMLDRALFRRFDEILELTMPTTETAIALLGDHLVSARQEVVGNPTVREHVHGLSYADLAAAAHRVQKRVVLDGKMFPSAAEITAALDQRRERTQGL